MWNVYALCELICHKLHMADQRSASVGENTLLDQKVHTLWTVTFEAANTELMVEIPWNDAGMINLQQIYVPQH